jgi:hypothetical protein
MTDFEWLCKTVASAMKVAVFGIVVVVIVTLAAVYAIAATSHPRPTNYRATLYDGGQVISAWICHEAVGRGNAVHLRTIDGKEVSLYGGAVIIEQVPARTEVR